MLSPGLAFTGNASLGTGSFVLEPALPDQGHVGTQGYAVSLKIGNNRKRHEKMISGQPRAFFSANNTTPVRMTDHTKRDK